MKKMSKGIWKAAQLLLFSVLCLLLICNVWMLTAKNLLGQPHPTVFGWSWAVVLSGSMEPVISMDDLVIYHRQSEYHPGDIVTFQSGGSLTTHRIVGEREGAFVTKGDANNTEDSTPVAKEDIVGRVVLTIPEVGVVLGYLKTPMGLCCLVLLCALLLAMPGLWK